MAATNLPALLAESLASFSNSTFQVFTEIEKQSRAEVVRAIADAQEARNERDQTTIALHASRLEEQSLKQELISCKASLKQAELTISHQTESIAQIRREANQWKDQSRNWQEHFLRVEQERCTLSTRIDELVAERLRGSHIVAPFTPKPQHVDRIGSAPSSTSTKRALTSASNVPPPYHTVRPASPFATPSPITSVNPWKSAQSIRSKPSKLFKAKASTETKTAPPIGSNMRNNPPVSKTRKPSLGSPTRTHRKEAQPAQRPAVIRRVEAVIHVKQEDTDDDLSGSDAKGEEADKVSHVGVVRLNMPKKRRILPHNDDERPSRREDSTDVPSRERQKDINDESCEDEGADNGGDDEDDELMMGAEDNRYELYGTHGVGSSAKEAHSPTEMPSSNKKRKLVGQDGGRKLQARKKV